MINDQAIVLKERWLMAIALAPIAEMQVNTNGKYAMVLWTANAAEMEAIMVPAIMSMMAIPMAFDCCASIS